MNKDPNTFKGALNLIDEEDYKTKSENGPIVRLGLFALTIFPVSVFLIVVISVLKGCGG